MSYQGKAAPLFHMAMTEHPREPHVPVMKLWMQKVRLHASDLLFRLLFFLPHSLALLCSYTAIICVIFCSALSCQSWMQMTLQTAPATVLLLSGQNTMPLETKYLRRVKWGPPAHLITAQVSSVNQNQNLIKYLWSCRLQMFAYRGEKQHMPLLWVDGWHNDVFVSSACLRHQILIYWILL